MILQYSYCLFFDVCFGLAAFAAYCFLAHQMRLDVLKHASKNSMSPEHFLFRGHDHTKKDNPLYAENSARGITHEGQS